MAKNSIVYFLFIVVFAAACSSGANKDPCANYELILASLSRSDTTKLIRRLKEICDSDTPCLNAFLTLGDLYIDLDSLPVAESTFKRALKLDDKNIYTLYQLGMVHHLRQEYMKAIECFETALDLKGKGNYSIDFNTNSKLSIDKYDIATLEIVYRKALSYYYNRNLKNSLADLNLCIENSYLLGDCYLYRGAIYLEANDKQKACTDFANALNQHNKDAGQYLAKYCH